MAGLYVIGRELFDRNTGLIAALFYSVFQPWWTWKNLTFDGEMLMNLPIIWAWAIAFRRSSSRLRPELFLAGALLGAAFLLKQPAAIAAVPLGIYLLLPSYRASRSLTRTNSIIQATMLTAGFLAALGLVTIVLWKQGILHEAFYWTIADHDVPACFWQKGIANTLTFLVACLPLVIGAIMACRDKSDIWAGRTAERTALFGLLAASAIGAAAGARFYPHYYVQLIPPLALLAAPYYAQTLVPDDAAASLVITTCGDLRVAGAHDCCLLNLEHWTGAGSAARAVGERDDICSTHSSPDDRIFVWGQYVENLSRRSTDVLPARYITVVSAHGIMSSADRSRVSILAAGSCPAPGPTSSRILPGIRRPTLSMFSPSPKSAAVSSARTFRFWPNFWRNGTSRSRTLPKV